MWRQAFKMWQQPPSPSGPWKIMPSYGKKSAASVKGKFSGVARNSAWGVQFDIFT